MQLLVVNSENHTLPGIDAGTFDDLGWQVTRVSDYRTAIRLSAGGDIGAVLLSAPPRTETHRESGLNELIDHLERRRIATLLVTDAPDDLDRAASMIAPVSRHVTGAELRGRLAMVERYQVMLQRLESELDHMQRLGKQLDRHFRELDEEMRLAGRLQRDFLPRVSGPVENIDIATIYRPAGWVSGDMYDVIQIDEDHLAVYVADAVGHGVAAGLLTMFIKQAITPTRIEGKERHILTPSEVIAGLNRALVEQDLPQCQFVTACYAVIDLPARRLSWARGGHPYPLLIRSGGGVSELESGGGLLGVSGEGAFPTAEVQLGAGDKVLFYTDGVELVFQSSRTSAVDPHAFRWVFRSFAAMPLQEMFDHVERALDSGRGWLGPQDDITLVGLELQ